MRSDSTSPHGISEATGRALTHRLAQAQRDGRVPSVVAAVARRGAPVWYGAAGLVDGAAPTEDTQYRIGSITKTMVAVLVLRLVERGVIGLDDQLGQHLTGAPAGDSTIAQLLSHSAGLASETPPPWWERTPGSHRPTLSDVLPEPPRRHPAGHVFHYSNPGYGLLGELVTRLEGRPWFEVLSEHVLTPLGMTRTGYVPTPPQARGWAVHPWADVLLPEPAHDHGLLAAAGQLWATPGDLCRFGVFLAGDGAGILPRQTLEAMRTPVAAPEDPAWSRSYGLGIQVLRYPGVNPTQNRVVFGHTGSMPGFLATLMTSTADGLTIAIQANAWSSLATAALQADLFSLLERLEPTLPEPWLPAEHVDPGSLELVGPWYWGAVPLALSLQADGALVLTGLTGRAREARFVTLGDGRWRGCDGYYHGEFLVPVRDQHGALSHLDLGSFILTRQPYQPADVIPDGLGLGSWQV